MSYTIDERNPERQQLLAEVLNPLTREVLAKLPRIPNATCLDLVAFADAAFDVVFCRYLLIHMAAPMRVVREMMRVVRPGDPSSVLVKFPDMWVVARR